MKKFLAFLSILTVICLTVLIPVSASSSETYDPVHFNSDPSFLVFTIPSSSSSFVVPDSVYEDYLFVDTTGQSSETYLPVYVQCLDSSLAIYNPTLVYVDIYRDGIFSQTLSFNSNELIIDYDLISSGRHNFTIAFRLSDPSVALCAILPAGEGSSSSASLDVNEWLSYFVTASDLDYNSLSLYNQGYQAGYLEGSQIGTVGAYNRGYDEAKEYWYQRGLDEGYAQGDYDGYQRGQQSDIENDIKGMIFYIVGAPFQAISNALNFEVLGVNLSNLVLFLFTGCILVFILRHFIL